MRSKIKEVIESLDSLSETKPIKIISHFDTDGITSAAIFSKTLQRWNKSFSLEIVKNLEDEFIDSLPENQILVFLDLGSGSLEKLSKKQTEIFILDHHEISQELIPKNITMINPHLFDEEKIASSAICYLLAKNISEQNQDLATLAVIGMIGDMLEKNIGKTYSDIIKDSDVTIKSGLLLYPATRPIDRVLENSSSPYIPEVTGSQKGTYELLREAGIEKTSKGFKSLAEFTEEEMSNLTTAIMLRSNLSKKDEKTENLIGNIYLIKFFNTLQDARELSALINACSRMDNSQIALGLCLGNKECKAEAEKIYVKYKKSISSALETLNSLQKIAGKGFIIINSKDKIKDTIIGTIASIISFSPLYEDGTAIITMAYTQKNPDSSQKIKVSARVAGRNGRNIFEVLKKATHSLSTEVGGHANAAGCLIPLDQEETFINNLKELLEIELVKV